MPNQGVESSATISQKDQIAFSNDAVGTTDNTVAVQKAMDNFIIGIEGIRQTAPFLETIIIAFIHKHKEQFESERDKYGTIIDETNGTQKIAFPINRASKAAGALKELDKMRAAQDTLPNMLLLSMVSIYDAFLTNLLKALFRIRPEMIFTSDKQVSFSEISNSNSLDEVKDLIIEKEVEGVLRQSHSKQFEKLERLFGVELRKALDIWSDFIEITERRNLFAHTNGVVSRQYISACMSNGVAIDQIPQVGETVSFTEDYFERTYQILLEICLKLGHVLWRKVAPGDLRASDQHYNAKCFDLIKDGQHEIAIKLLDLCAVKLRIIPDKIYCCICRLIVVMHIV